MNSDNYTQYLYSNRRYQESAYSGQLAPSTFASKEIDLLPKCRPLLFGGNLYGIIKNNIIISWSLQQKRINWEFVAPEHFEIEQREESGIITIDKKQVIAFQYPYLFALDLSGEEIWRKKISYSFYSEHTLIYEDKIIVFAVDKDLNNFILCVNTKELTIEEIPYDKKIMPDFLIADQKDSSTIIIGHNNGKVTAAIDKLNLRTKQIEWSKEFLAENTIHYEKSKRRVYWQGRTVYWNNVIISGIFGNRIVAINSDTGSVSWSVEIADQYTFSFDIKEDKLYLLDETHIKEIDIATGKILSEIQVLTEQHSNEFREYNTILNINGNQLIIGSLFKNQIGIINISSGEIVWKNQLNWSIDSNCPIVTNDELLIYNSIEGKAKVFYKSR